MSSSMDIEWLRPCIHKLPDPKEDAITFQHIDIDHYQAPKWPSLVESDNVLVSVVRMYGVTEGGESVLCHVHGFLSYFYVYTQKEPDQSKLTEFKKMLNRRVGDPTGAKIVLQVVSVSAKSVYGYYGNDQQYFLKIVVAKPEDVRSVKNLFVDGNIDSMDVFFEGRLSWEGHQIFESNIDYEIKFMCDLNICGCSWITLPRNKYQLRTDESRTSHCQLECDIDHKDLVAHPPEGKWAHIAPFRMLSFDIETTVHDTLIPRPEHESVIQISNILVRHGHEQASMTCIFTLRSCAPIPGVVVKSYNSELEMLVAWSKFMADVDPDVITGWRIRKFDLNFLIKRAQVLGLRHYLYLGRLAVVPMCRVMRFEFRNEDHTYIYNTEGRVQFDLYEVFRRYQLDKPNSATLNHVAGFYLKKNKIPMKFTQITGLFNKTAETRRTLARYCIHDSRLVLELINKLECFEYLVEIARVTGAPIWHLLDPTLHNKLNTQILREAKKHGYLVPDVQIGLPWSPNTLEPIITSSAPLRPSVIIDNSLCFTTLMNRAAIERYALQPHEYIETPVGFYFKRPDKSHQTILPSIFKNLLEARERVRDDLSKVTRVSSEETYMKSRTTALIISTSMISSSIGYYKSGLPCQEIAESVPSLARRTPAERTEREPRALENRA